MEIGASSRAGGVLHLLSYGAHTMTESSRQEPKEKDLAAIDPRIQEAVLELTSERAINILLVIIPKTYCDPLLLGLAALGHHVVIAKSSEKALQNFYDNAFDLVICDQGSEDNTCAEFAAQLRTLDPHQRILVIDFGQPPPS